MRVESWGEMGGEEIQQGLEVAERGRAAAEVEGGDRGRGKREKGRGKRGGGKELMELMEDAINVLVAFFLGASDIGVKGAVGALAPAEREMDVEVEGLRC